MQVRPLLPGLMAVVAVLAGCATQPEGPPGKYLVYRDGAGAAVRQFEYPDDGFCRKVERSAGRAARCQPASATGLAAQATLRYNPPGVDVPAQYADLNRCRADTATMAPGVELRAPCSPK